MTPKGAAAVATKGAMRGSDGTPPFAPAPGPLNDEYLHVDDDVHLDDMISWLDNPASGANNAAPPAHHLFGEARIHHSNNTHRSKLERALELIRASELEESPLESEQGLIQLWIPEDMADSHFGPRRLQNVVVGTTTKAGSSAESPDATAMESSSEEEGPATGTALATLAEFGERSKRYRFKVEGGLAEGLPGRVFVSGRPEMTLDVRNYGRENYLRINEAKSCGIKAAVGIPVYRVEGSWRETVAVVEISKVSDKLRMERLSCKLAEAFESVDLLTWGRETPSVKFGNWPFNVHVQRTSAILNTLVEAVCQLRGIAYVACWGKKSPDHHCLPSTSAPHPHPHPHPHHRNLAYLSCDALPCGVQHSDFIKYRQVCSTRAILEGHGIVGTAWAKNASIWHADISNLPPEINPYSQFGVRNDSLKGAVVAVPITLSRESGKASQGNGSKYVMEIFITEVCRDVEEQRRLIVDMLSLFLRIGGGRFDIGVLLEYFDPPQSIPSGFPADGARPIHRVGSLESRGLAHVADIGGGEEEAGRKRKKSSPGMAAAPAATPAVNPPTRKTSPLGGAKKTGGTSNKKSISLETLHKYFKYNLKEAAKKLNVCPTTLKRVCRQHGIPRWPCRKLKKVNRSMAKLQGVVENCPGVDAAAIGFPDLKAACVFDTSSSEQVSRGAQRVGILHGGVRGPSPLEEVTSKGKRAASAVGEVGPSGSHGPQLLSHPPQSALSKELKEGTLGMGKVGHAPLHQPMDPLSAPMMPQHAQFPPGSLPACSPIPIPHPASVNGAPLAYPPGPHFNPGPYSLANVGSAPGPVGDQVYHQSASCLTPPMLSPSEREVGLQGAPGETSGPGEGVLDALSRRIWDIEEKLLAKRGAGGSAKGDRALVEINQRLKALEKAYNDEERAEAGAS